MPQQQRPQRTTSRPAALFILAHPWNAPLPLTVNRSTSSSPAASRKQLAERGGRRVPLAAHMLQLTAQQLAAHQAPACQPFRQGQQRPLQCAHAPAQRSGPRPLRTRGEGVVEPVDAALGDGPQALCDRALKHAPLGAAHEEVARHDCGRAAGCAAAWRERLHGMRRRHGKPGAAGTPAAARVGYVCSAPGSAPSGGERVVDNQAAVHAKRVVEHLQGGSGGAGCPPVQFAPAKHGWNESDSAQAKALPGGPAANAGQAAAPRWSGPSPAQPAAGPPPAPAPPARGRRPPSGTQTGNKEDKEQQTAAVGSRVRRGQAGPGPRLHPSTQPVGFRRLPPGRAQPHHLVAAQLLAQKVDELGKRVLPADLQAGRWVTSGEHFFVGRRGRRGGAAASRDIGHHTLTLFCLRMGASPVCLNKMTTAQGQAGPG